MAVPAQDQRDWDFAERYGLPIVRTVQPPDDFDGQAYTGDGLAINSDSSDPPHRRHRPEGHLAERAGRPSG